MTVFIQTPTPRRPPRRDQDGYRYIRQYRTTTGPSWALYERGGGRMRRVGTARSVADAYAFIRSAPPKTP
jgi:hypothetical protein